MDEPLWKAYEVLLDVWKDVFAYGYLPSNLLFKIMHPFLSDRVII